MKQDVADSECCHPSGGWRPGLSSGIYGRFDGSRYQQHKQLTARFQWSKLGRPVYLLDKEKTQLPWAYNELQHIRVRLPTADVRSPVNLATTDKLDMALEHSWLVVEVSTSLNGLLIRLATNETIDTVRSRIPCAETLRAPRTRSSRPP